MPHYNTSHIYNADTSKVETCVSAVPTPMQPEPQSRLRTFKRTTIEPEPSKLKSRKRLNPLSSYLDLKEPTFLGFLIKKVSYIWG